MGDTLINAVLADYELDDEDDPTLVTSADYAEMMGLSRSDGVSFL